MQKQFLLNTLLLIGAICLSTRGVAHANEFSQDNAPQAVTQEADPINQPAQSNQEVAPVIQSNGAQEPSNVHTSTQQANQPAQTTQQDDSSEDMD